MTSHVISVILPAYRASSVVAAGVARVRNAMPGVELEIIVVDDGSGDNTHLVARRAGADKVIKLAKNRGKGAAVRAGMMSASGSYFVFTDVDLSYDPSQISVLVEALDAGADVALGSRRHPSSSEITSAPALREQGSRIFNQFTRLVVGSSHLDTQCGLKGFTAEAAKQIFSRTKVDGFAFDVEVLHLAEKLELKMTEVPVVLDHVEQTTIRFVPQATRMLWDVLKIRMWSALRRYPDLTSKRG
ncbi:MAG: hypothetical protein CL464_07675 [Acidimicrobiaceae bacterium]|nr:hypothetical protein [Acidimicrobiaceae bacterium]MEE2680685.1 glycosyltransferase [Actinomycetota bacterium]MEE2807248.1 glycosyltransferase [Actinomycetota bacterium]|tara:strand:- start:5421 stop:6152 length:732 start_codon:yes stop_codon:yes gene_type:complete